MSSKKVIIIGAGFGGMVAGAYLAKAGHEVTIIEKNKTVGGVAQSIKKKGFTFDLGPSWYVLPDVLEEFFSDFNSSVEQQYGVTQLRPSFKLFTHETDYAVSTWPEVAEIFDSLDPGSSKRLQKMFVEGEKQYDQLRSSGRVAVGLLGRNKTFAERVAQVTKNQDLQHMLEFQSVFYGINPQQLPSVYSWLAYAGLGPGIWHPHGGFSSVVKAVQSVAKKSGVTFKLGAPVEKVLVENRRVTGVVSKGVTIECDVVIGNADMHHIETDLLEKSSRSYDEKFWQKQTMSSSVLVGCLGIKKSLPGLAHHNLIFDVSWEQHLEEVFQSNTWSAKPTIYLSNPTKTDPSLAPKGMETLIFLAPMTNDVVPTEEQIDRTTLSMIGRVQEELGYEFVNDIVVAEVKSQEYFTETFNAYKGSAFGLSHIAKQIGSKRPKLESHRVRGLYYVGQDTLPGAGVPQVIMSGKQVANIVNNS